MDNNRYKTDMRNTTKIDSILPKMPPQAVDVEEIILGALMLERDVIDIAINELKAEDFYNPAHVLIFETIVELYNAHQPVDLITMTSKLRERKKLDDCGGALYLADLTNRVGSASNTEYYCKVVKEQSVKRQIIEMTSIIQTLAYEQSSDVFTNLGLFVNKLMDIEIAMSNNVVNKTMSYFNELMQNTMDRMNGIDTNLYMSCGFDSIDRKFGMIERGNLIHIGGRPGSGKTSFMISSMMNLCARGHTCVFFTLEMSAYEILRNMVAKDFRIDSKDLKKGTITNEMFNAIYDRFVGYIKAGLLIIEDLANATVLQIESKVRTLKSEKPIDYVYTDYTQLIKSGNPKHNEVEKINYVTKSLKQSAKYNKVVWFSGSQHGRAVDSTKDRRALMSHLKGSGSIEEDSDIVISLWRPQYYFESLGSNERDNFATLMYEGVEYPCEDLAMIDVLKNRGSRVGEILFSTSMMSSLFSDFTDFRQDQRLNTVVRNDFVEPPKEVYTKDEELPF